MKIILFPESLSCEEYRAGSLMKTKPDFQPG